MIQRIFRLKHKYDTLVWLLLIWCIFQDFVLSFFYRITGAEGLTKVIFHSKDVLTLALLFGALPNLNMSKRIFGCILMYYGFVFIQLMITLTNGSNPNIISVLSSTRGLILLPTMMIIGQGVRDKREFFEITKKYYRLLVLLAIVGIVEVFIDNTIGMESFWMKLLGLGEYHAEIKGQSDLLFKGVPWNWHTNGRYGNMTRRRLVSVWAGSLTAGAVLLLPCMFYTINFFKNGKFLTLKISESRLKALGSMMICFVALDMTVARQFFLPYIGIALISFVYYNKKNRKMLIIGGTLFLIIIAGVFFDTIWTYIYDGSTMIHIAQIQKAMQYIKLWGSSVGSFGTRFADTISTESQYMTVLGQLGIIPLVLYLIILIYPIMYCRRKVSLFDGYIKPFICSLCFSGMIYSVAGIVSETVAAYTSIAQYYIFIGFVWGYCSKFRKDDTKYETKAYRNVLTTIS